MSAKRSFLKDSNYTVDDDVSGSVNFQTLNPPRRKFLNFNETSNNTDVSSESETEDFQPFKRKRKKFLSEDLTPSAEKTRTFLSDTAEEDLFDDESSDNSSKNTIARHSFLRGNLIWREDEDSCDQPKRHPQKDPIEEALALLTKMSKNNQTSQETSKLIKAAAEQIHFGSVSESDGNKGSKPTSSVNELKKDSSKKEKSNDNVKGSLSAADLKERILQKVPFIRHTDGLYAYNGRTYIAVNNPNQLVGIVINQVDEKMFNLTTTNIFTSVLTMLQEDNRLKPDDYAERAVASEGIIVFKNTLLDIRTLKKIPFNPWYITSYEIDANYISHPEPDVYLDFLRSTSGGDPEIADCITDCISYILSGTNQGKIFFVLGNAPDSGKSSLATFLQGIINEKYIFNIAPHEFKDRFSLGGHRGRVLNISMDLSSTKLHPEVVATIKKITGGDKLMSQDKNEKKEFGVSSMRLLFGTNHAVSVNPSDDNDAFWNRLQVVPFTQTISPEDKDPHLVQKMLEERDDIVSYCIQRMPSIVERGYKLSSCQAAEDIKNEWRYGISNDDSLESFCDTYLEITGDKDDVILATDIYTPYREFCKTINVKPLREEKIKEWFNSHGGSCERKRLPGIKNAQSVILGIRLRKEYRELAHEDVSDEDVNEVYEE